MEFNHLHLYVDDLAHWRDQFVRRWGGQAQAVPPSVADHTALICLGRVPLLLSAPRTPQDAVATYLRQHPLGVGDIAFWVPDLDATLARLTAHDGPPPSPVVEDSTGGRWCQVQGWGSLRHTLVQSARPMAWVPGAGSVDSVDSGDSEDPTGNRPAIDHIDHGVINVPVGQLAAAVDWYVQRFGFRPQQEFTIDTPWSGLRSQVLAHPHGGATLPINEPTTPNSQVQEFLHWNRGPGVQHVALHTSHITQTVQRLKALGVTFLDVPQGYYQALAQRPGYGVLPNDNAPSDLTNLGYRSDYSILDDLVRLNILVDWDSQTPQAKLLQTFTQPVFNQPTLFFEIIQRQSAWVGAQPILAQGFGERNFQALFEAIEQEQRKRGSLV